MTWILDSSTETTISLSALEGSAAVGLISAPSMTYPGETITITLPVTNQGVGPDTLMVKMYMLDPDTGENIIAPVQSEMGVVDVNQTMTATFNMTIPATWNKESINLYGEGYHLEGF